jgi:pyruvate dehydrogenase E2 component (dihydrolipoamide acetyltransferase)
MATSVIMPRQGQSVESCILSKWHKQPGDPVKTGDLLFSYETDKASFDEEAKADGVLIVVLAEENDDVPCLAEVCRIGTAEEFAAGDGGASEPVPEAGPVLEAGPVPEDTAFAISPRARALAVRTGVDPSLAMPSGPDGRIIERDIQKLAEAGTRMTPAAAAAMAGSVSGVARTGLGGRVTTADVARGSVVAAGMAGGVASSAPSGTVAGSGASTTAAVPTAALPDATADLPGYTDTALPNIRKVIAKAMFQSISTTCQLTLNTSFDATALRQQRALFKQAGEKMPEVAGITLTDMILFAVARTLPAHPDLNAWFMDTHIRRFAHVHLGLAVDTERGLMVPTIFGADTMSLAGSPPRPRRLPGNAKPGPSTRTSSRAAPLRSPTWAPSASNPSRPC